MKACVEPLNQHIKINDGNLPLSSREKVQQMSFIIKELFCFVCKAEPYWLKYSTDIICIVQTAVHACMPQPYMKQSPTESYENWYDRPISANVIAITKKII